MSARVIKPATPDATKRGYIMAKSGLAFMCVVFRVEVHNAIHVRSMKNDQEVLEALGRNADV